MDKKDTQKEEREVYLSQDGFVDVPFLRGHTEIDHLYNFLFVNNARLFKGRVFICGGYVRYMCSPQRKPVPANDVDIYVADPDIFPDLVDRFEHTFELKRKHENEISITYPRADKADHPLFATPPIQMIKPNNVGKIVATGTLDEILGNFDFTVIRAGLPNMGMARVDADFMHDEAHKLLRLKNIHCPVSSLLRCYKYARKGYFMRPMEALRLFVDWEHRDAEYRAKIIDFLTKADSGEGLSEEDINELEKLMRID